MRRRSATERADARETVLDGIRARAREDAREQYVREVESYLADTHAAIDGLRETIALLRAHATARYELPELRRPM